MNDGVKKVIAKPTHREFLKALTKERNQQLQIIRDAKYIMQRAEADAVAHLAATGKSNLLRLNLSAINYELSILENHNHD